MPPQSKLRVLFLRTHNSARSQMAEGRLRAIGGAECDEPARLAVVRMVRDRIERRIEERLRHPLQTAA